MNYLLKRINIWPLKSFLLLVFMLLSSCAFAQDGQGMIINMSYHEARKIILENGWKPAEGMSAYDEIGAAAHYFRDLGYAEVNDCTGAGTLSCLFYFQNEQGEYLKIGTSGEYPDPYYEIQTKVVLAAIRNEIDE